LIAVLDVYNYTVNYGTKVLGGAEKKVWEKGWFLYFSFVNSYHSGGRAIA
jgi:hypothetical protein